MSKEPLTLLLDSLGWIRWALTQVRWDIVFTICASFMAAYLATYFRDKSTAKATHFQILKSQVLEPILSKLTRYHLPLLELKRNIVVRDSIAIEEESASVTLRPIKDWQKTLRVIPVGHLVGTESNAIGDADVVLYADAKRQHFPRLIGTWENFEQRANKCYENCLELAKRSEACFREKKGSLPELTGSNQNSEFISPAEIAWWITRKQMGTFPNDSLVVERDAAGSERVALKTGPDGVVLARGPDIEINSLVTRANQIVYADKNTQPLREVAEALAKEAQNIEAKIKDVLYTAHLPGHCKYY